MHPGAKIGVKGAYGVKEINIGDPQSAMTGLEFVIGQLNQGLGINAIRAGAGDDPSDKTATEITTSDVKAEIRTGEFVDKQERHALRPFLYMQHELNKGNLKSYTFFNPEIDAPDFMTLGGDELPENVVFDVVGSRGAIGEKARSTAVANVTAGLLSHPKTQNIPNVMEIAKMAYQDAGVRNPERIMNTEEPKVPQEIQQKMQETEQQMQELQKENYQLKENLAISKAVNQAKLAETTQRSQVNADSKEYTVRLMGELEKLKASIDMAKAQDGSVSVKDISAMHDKLTGLLNPEEENAEEEDGVSAALQGVADMMSQPIRLRVIKNRDGTTEVIGGREQGATPRPVVKTVQRQKQVTRNEIASIVGSIENLNKSTMLMMQKMEKEATKEATSEKPIEKEKPDTETTESGRTNSER